VLAHQTERLGKTPRPRAEQFQVVELPTGLHPLDPMYGLERP
jgi:hypothetical protein